MDFKSHRSYVYSIPVNGNYLIGIKWQEDIFMLLWISIYYKLPYLRIEDTQ